MKYVAIIVIAFLFLGCSIPSVVDEIETPTIPLISSYYEASLWVDTNIRYTSDEDGDFWQYPEETMELGTGDCEDMALLWLWLVYENMGVKGLLVISTDGEEFHAHARVGEFTFNSKSSYHTVREYTYDDMWEVVSWKR